MNKIVKYHNDFNTVNMREWTKEEMNFMFSILWKFKEKGTEELTFDKSSLTELTKYTERHNLRFNDVIKNLVDHVISMKYIEQTSHTYKVMNLFQTFEAKFNNDYSDVTLTISVNSKFEYILNQLNANFTSFELEEFITLRSTYSKTMYRLLKQWRTIGNKEYSVEELKEYLSIPKSYKACHIDKVVLQPIQKELSQYFYKLKITPIKKKTKGNPIIAYKFTWKAEEVGQWIDNKFKFKAQNKPIINDKLPDYTITPEANKLLTNEEALAMLEKYNKEND